MTRPAPKLTNELFPDWQRVLSRAARVETETVRHCEVCGCDESEMKRLDTFDGHVCVDEAGCWRRENKARRIA